MPNVYLIPCSNSKRQGGNTPSNLAGLSFNEILGPCRRQLIALTGITLNWNFCLPAYQRYAGNHAIIYPHVQNQVGGNPNSLLIVSALFGILKPTDLIPDYNLVMDNRNAKFWRNQHDECTKCILNSVLQSEMVINPQINFTQLLTGPYQKAFCGFQNGGGPPAINSIPGLITPPTWNGGFDNRGHWRRRFLEQNL